MAERTKIIAGNWKMNLGPNEAVEYFSAMGRELAQAAASAKTTQNKPSLKVIFPPAYALGREIQTLAKQAGFELGAQNCHWADKGAFTGELSASTLKSIGIHWVLIGHSERRQYFSETDETASLRFKKAASLDLNVVYCIGETLKQREANQTEDVLTRQMLAFMDVFREQIQRPICPWPHQVQWAIAYEPVWAIGTGKTATNQQAEDAHKHIRRVIWDSLGMEVAQRVQILYGGSVTPENARELMGQPNIDGVLVGGASLKADGFAKIIGSV